MSPVSSAEWYVMMAKSFRPPQHSSAPTALHATFDYVGPAYLCGPYMDPYFLHLNNKNCASNKISKTNSCLNL